MNGLDFIQTKQISWANRHGIKLVGSQSAKGARIYTEKLEDNLFEPLSNETRHAIDNGDGGELKAKGNNLPKMQALHSSSALGVNIFQYWKNIHKINEIAFACGLCSADNKNSIDIKFEEKLKISEKFQYPPNIDVVIKNSENSTIKIFGIECKFSEAYVSRKHEGLKDKYLTEIDEQWKDLPNLHNYSKSISPTDNVFQFLHPAQLVKHILGLKKQYGKTSFRLLYLWYDVYGEEGTTHRKEIEIFKEIAHKDKIMFHSFSYQELIIKLSKHFYNKNEKYMDYITDRYL